MPERTSTGLRLAITGDGATCALGAGIPAMLAALRAGRVSLAPAPLATSLRRPPPVFAAPDPPAGPEAPDLYRTTRLALCAAREAAATAWPAGLPVPSGRIGVCVGTTVGCTLNHEPFYHAYRRGEDPGTGAVQRHFANDLAACVADAVGARGPLATVANACASSADAIGLAASWLAAGDCDAVVAGGADELVRYPYIGFALLQNVAFEACRPFDLHRSGLNLGEGAGLLVLEREEDARRRGAPVLGRLLGYANAADAHHATTPHPDGRGLREALAVALRWAGVDAHDVGLVSAHGTGTIENDRVEGKVLADLFPAGTVVCATKGYTGHTLAAAAVLATILAVHGLREGWVPRSAGFATPDPECRVVPTTAHLPLDAQFAVSTALAFGGTNSVLVLERGDR
jgi:3-oxoacyl-[acyl-carrier-protein] synthase-1/3-oxoacyl-[acyl-carrier-protein] synthase II